MNPSKKKLSFSFSPIISSKKFSATSDKLKNVEETQNSQEIQPEALNGSRPVPGPFSAKMRARLGLKNEHRFFDTILNSDRTRSSDSSLELNNEDNRSVSDSDVTSRSRSFSGKPSRTDRSRSLSLKMSRKEVNIEDFCSAWQTSLFLLEEIQISEQSNEQNSFQPTGGVHRNSKQDASLMSMSEAQATEFLKNISVNVEQMRFWGERRFQLSLYRSEMLFVQLFLSVLEKGLGVNVFEHKFMNGIRMNTAILQLSMKDFIHSSDNLGLCRDGILRQLEFCQNLSLVCNSFCEKLILCKVRVIPSNCMQQTSLLIECNKYRTSIEICGQSPEHSNGLKDALNISIRVILEGLGVIGASPEDYHDHFEI